MEIQSIDFEEAKHILDSAEPHVFFDVREEEEYVVGHAEGAQLFSLDTISKNTAQRMVPSKDTKILVYCRTGRRSRMAAEKLAALGYRAIYDVGSLSGWPYGMSWQGE